MELSLPAVMGGLATGLLAGLPNAEGADLTGGGSTEGSAGGRSDAVALICAIAVL